MNYGSRQSRAEWIVSCMRGKTEPVWKDHLGKPYTPDQIADEIEKETDVGRSFVAIGGFVLQATVN